MTWDLRARRVAEFVIRRAGRRLPADVRAERCREWAAELPAILSDPGVRGPALRQARALRYAAGVYRGARRVGRSAGRPRAAAPPAWASRSQRRPPERITLPDGVLLVAAAVALWASCVVFINAFPPHGGPDYPVIAAAAVAGILALAGEIRFVRWLRRTARGSRPR
jgi:hypothetical protein